MRYLTHPLRRSNSNHVCAAVLHCGYSISDDRRHVNGTYVHIERGSQHRLRIPTIVSRRAPMTGGRV
jgi:hypothetical protein